MNARTGKLMLMPADIPLMERRLAEVGISVGQLCAVAGIDRSTWTRWRQGTVIPSLDNWGRAVAAFTRLSEPNPNSNSEPSHDTSPDVPA